MKKLLRPSLFWPRHEVSFNGKIFMSCITRNILQVFITGWLWLGFSAAWSQSHFPVDSSFSLRRELTKQLKHHPDIHPAEVGDTSMLSLHRDVVYTSYVQRQLHADIVFLS